MYSDRTVCREYMENTIFFSTEEYLPRQVLTTERKYKHGSDQSWRSYHVQPKPLIPYPEYWLSQTVIYKKKV